MHPRALPLLPLLALPLVPLATACSKTGGGMSGFEGEITMRTTHPAAPPQDLLVETKGEKIRFNMPSMGGQTAYALFDPAANKVTLVMETQKAYTDLDFSGAASAPNTSAETSAVEKTGKHEKIAGMDCEDWVAKDPSGSRSEVCIASGITFFDMASLRSGSPTALAKELREKKLFPLRSVEYSPSGMEVSRMEVTKIEKKSLDAQRFALPAGFTKMTMPAGLPAAGMRPGMPAIPGMPPRGAMPRGPGAPAPPTHP